MLSRSAPFGYAVSSPRLLVRPCTWLAFCIVVFTARFGRLDGGLLYPDGYQYLLMSKGIALNGRAILDTGRGGDVLIPNTDAALKPFEPLLVAICHLAGLGWLDSARLVTAVAGAAVVILAALITRRLTGSDILAAGTGAICLASPTLTWWAGFFGPDMLAPALGLAALLAAREQRPRLAGVLAALAATTRPEYLLAALGVLIGAALGGQRRAAKEALPAAALTMALVIGVTRPPITAPTGIELLQASIGCLIVAAAYALVPRLAARRRLLSSSAAAAFAIAAFAAFTGKADGLHQLASQQPLLVGVVVVGSLLALESADRVFAARVLMLIGLVVSIYWQKNPNLDRYLIQLLPFFAILAAVGVARFGLRPLVVGIVGACALVTTIGHPAPAPLATDSFRTIASQLAATGQPLISASPDAYSFWLPNRPQRLLRAGSRGLILIDATARSFLPHIRGCGATLATLDSGPGFRTPSGAIDDRPARLLQGTATPGFTWRGCSRPARPYEG
jgi:hypothetical protein